MIKSPFVVRWITLLAKSIETLPLIFFCKADLHAVSDCTVCAYNIFVGDDGTTTLHTLTDESSQRHSPKPMLVLNPLDREKLLIV